MTLPYLLIVFLSPPQQFYYRTEGICERAMDAYIEQGYKATCQYVGAYSEGK